MKLTQTIDATGVLTFNSAARLFLLDSTGAAASVDVEILRAGSQIFDAPGVARGFRVFMQSAFDGVRIKAAAGTVVSFFLATEDVQISTTNGAAVSVPGGVLVNNAGAGQKVPVEVFGAVFNATNIGIMSPAVLAGAADVSVNATTTTQIIAADAVNTEREVIIKNLLANAATMRIGGATAAASVGHELAPGESITLNTKAVIYAYNAGAAAQSVSVLVNSRA